MEVKTLHDRLQIAAGERTYRQIARLTETHPETVRRYMQGQAPSVEFLTGFCASLKLNGSWLLTGEGPMHEHEVRPHALRTADAPDLLRALSDTVAMLIGRVDRLERLVQTTEMKLRAAGGGAGSAIAYERDIEPGRGPSAGNERAQTPADRVGSAVAQRAPDAGAGDDAARGP